MLHSEINKNENKIYVFQYKSLPFLSFHPSVCLRDVCIYNSLCYIVSES